MHGEIVKEEFLFHSGLEPPVFCCHFTNYSIRVRFCTLQQSVERKHDYTRLCECTVCTAAQREQYCG
jgi:hypothetical protein